MLGQEASSHTVFNCKSRNISLTLPTLCHWGALTLSQSGFTLTLIITPNKFNLLLHYILLPKADLFEIALQPTFRTS
jgi:hypothetical protein